MKEFTEKLIGRFLAECVIYAENYEKALDMANQLAEEYKAIINGQYCWQTCGATEHCKECNRLCNGSIDYYENYDVLAEEYNNDFCEWRLCDEEANVYDTTCRNPHILLEGSPSDNNYKFCPYCGKKIKAVE